LRFEVGLGKMGARPHVHQKWAWWVTPVVPARWEAGWVTAVPVAGHSVPHPPSNMATTGHVAQLGTGPGAAVN
jgi:hypothetical protein